MLPILCGYSINSLFSMEGFALSEAFLIKVQLLPKGGAALFVLSTLCFIKGIFVEISDNDR